MKQVAIAFDTTGANPKEGHRFSELVARQIGNDKTLRLNAGADGLKDQLQRLLAFTDGAQVVVLDGARWRRFMRAELKAGADAKARGLMKDVFDVGAWAKERFPRQRKDVEAIGRQVGVRVDGDATGLEREVMVLAAIVSTQADAPDQAPSEHNFNSHDTSAPAVAQPVSQSNSGRWSEIKALGNCMVLKIKKLTRVHL